MVKKSSNVTIILENGNNYQATYFYEYFQKKRRLTPESIEDYCKNFPNFRYRFEDELNHFLIYKDHFGYGDENEQYKRSELVGVEEKEIGQDSAKEKCLELLLNDKDILYKVVLIKLQNAEMQELNRLHAGWVK